MTANTTNAKSIIRWLARGVALALIVAGALGFYLAPAFPIPALAGLVGLIVGGALWLLPIND
ncbi:MAG: hypothetical protein GEV06_28945, partial [Luteitalea sp.]|nr:hypothetical protein [Luteitalea sp.]